MTDCDNRGKLCGKKGAFLRRAGGLGLLALMGSLQAADEVGALDPRALVGGTSVSAATYPYVVYLQTEKANGHFSGCTGALIRPTWVLTAAHCILDDGDPVPYGSINVGYDCNKSANTCEEIKSASDSPVDWKVVHPGYDSSLEAGTRGLDLVDIDLIVESRLHDLALLRLASPFSAARSFPQLAGWPDEARLGRAGREAAILGYGGLEGEADPSRLQRRFVRLFSGDECPPNEWKLLCAYSSTDFVRGGDSGAPVVARLGGRSMLFGILAGGALYNSSAPSSRRNEYIFVSVARHRAWIMSTMNLFGY